MTEDRQRPYRSRTLPTVGVVLPGGGALGAYQVGVLAGIAEILPEDTPGPFRVVAGTSAGAMNAAYIASHMDRYPEAVQTLEKLWSDLTVGRVYRAGYGKILGTILHWVFSLMFGGLGQSNPRSLLDNTPLRNLLAEHIDFDALERNIADKVLQGLSITVAGYASERSLVYFQADSDIQPWWRERREGRPVKLTLDHVMASLALPIVFPAVKIDSEWCGDGSTRQFAPLSPAIHLGADKVLIIDTRHQAPYRSPLGAELKRYPSLSRISGYLLDSIFSDSLYADLERANRINRTLAHIPANHFEPDMPNLRHVDTLLISPSRRPRRLAARHIDELPKGIRWLLGALGGEEEGGELLLSYMLFDGHYCRDLIDLGKRDVRARREEVLRFLDYDTKSVQFV